MIIEPLKVFISYKWEENAHNEWVWRFAAHLRSRGIDAILDKWEVRLGDSFTDYMTKRISEADIILFIITPRSVAAVEASDGSGGAVKFEMQMATARRTAGEKVRLIGIYREGNDTPAHLRDHLYADFRDDSKYHENFRELVLDLLGFDKRPPLHRPVAYDGYIPEWEVDVPNIEKIDEIIHKGIDSGHSEKMIVDELAEKGVFPAWSRKRITHIKTERSEQAKKL